MKMLLAILVASVLLLYGCTQNAGQSAVGADAGAQAAGPAGSTMPAKGEDVPETGVNAGPVDSQEQVGGDSAEAWQTGPADGSGVVAGEAQAGAGNAGSEGTDGDGAGAMGAVKEFTVEAVMWDFSPKTITVNKGDTVKITLVNKDVSHGIAIREFGFDLKADAGQTATGEFVADKEGTYTFKCNIFCGEGHREMAGTLVVK